MLIHDALAGVVHHELDRVTKPICSFYAVLVRGEFLTVVDCVSPLEYRDAHFNGLLEFGEHGDGHVVGSRPADPHTLTSMSAHAGVSPRHLNRLFQSEVGTTPIRWLEEVRVNVAKALILEGHSITRAAQFSGLGSDETLRRVFAKHLGTTPAAFRERFSTTHRRHANRSA